MAATSQTVQSTKKSQYVTSSGVDFINDELMSDRKLVYDLSPDDNPVGFGKSVTPRAANEMVKRRIRENIAEIITEIDKTSANKITTVAQLIPLIEDKLKGDRIATEFGKESLMRILSQNDCVGIRFTNCKNSKGENSIVAIGITAEEINGKVISVPLQKAKYKETKAVTGLNTTQLANLQNDSTDPIDEEEGNGTDTLTVLENMGLTLTKLVDDVDRDFDIQKIIKQLSNKITASFFGNPF